MRHFHRDAHWAERMRESFQGAWFEAQPGRRSADLQVGICAISPRADPALRGQRYCGAASTRAARKAAGPEGRPCGTPSLVVQTGKGFMQVSLDKSWVDGGMRAGGAGHQQTRMAVSVFHAQSLLTHERKVR